jgi:hypothetical protein
MTPGGGASGPSVRTPSASQVIHYRVQGTGQCGVDSSDRGRGGAPARAPRALAEAVREDDTAGWRATTAPGPRGVWRTRLTTGGEPSPGQ